MTCHGAPAVIRCQADRVKLPMLGLPVLGPLDTVRLTRGAWRSGLLRPYRPDQLAQIALAVRRYGMGPATGPAAGRVLYPGEPALVDDDGTLTFAELDAACDAAGVALAERGLRPGSRIGLLARNSRDFYAAMVGAARAGIDVVYLNTGATKDQVRDVAKAEGLGAVVHDAEFGSRVPKGVTGLNAAALLAPRTPARRPDAGGRTARHVILTSGTTGRPRGVSRDSVGVAAVVPLLSRFPYRVRERHLLAAPAFHAWGWMNLLLTMLFSSTVVMTRKFDPEHLLELAETERTEVLVAVPVMLQRLVDLGPGTASRYDTSSLRVAAVSGSALSGALADAFMDMYGEVLFNLYGSTEAAFATLAEPRDLRVAPGTAGRPLPGVRVAVVDESGQRLPDGDVGQIVVGSGATFSGYTSGEDGERMPGGVRIGDLGRFDDGGRLFVVGRSDDLVVTGGENVYPVTVENALERHPDVVEGAVVGEPDRDFGEALVAHVVLRDGRSEPMGGDDEETAIRTWLKQRVGSHEVPRRVVVHAEPLPRNASGKVVKSKLREAGTSRG